MKYLKVANETIASQKSRNWKNLKYPSWYEDQMAKHLARPAACPHPDRYLNDNEFSWVLDDDTGECELHLPYGDDMFEPSERAAMMDAPGLDVAEENKNRRFRPK